LPEVPIIPSRVFHGNRKTTDSGKPQIGRILKGRIMGEFYQSVDKG